MMTESSKETFRSRQQRRLLSRVRLWDMYGHTPTYDFPAYTTWFGVVATFLTVIIFVAYMGITLSDYIRRSPELVLQGAGSVDGVSYPAPDLIAISVRYQDSDGNRKYVMANNTSPYFSVEAVHSTIQKMDSVPRIYTPLPFKTCGESINENLQYLLENIDENLLCVDQDYMPDMRLEGTYTSQTYKYIEFNIGACRNTTDSGISKNCASDEEIQSAIRSQVEIKIVSRVQTFDVNAYHNFKRDEQSVNSKLNSDRWYLLPNLRVMNEMYLLGRSIAHERPHTGSPPLPETNTNLLTSDVVDSRLQPASDDGRFMTFYFRLSQTISFEETAYWMPTVLDLFGLWGALASFLTTLSFGLVATRYNRYKSNRSYNKNVARLSAERQDDIRLFEKKNFNECGRLVATDEELATPTTTYGEMRSFANQEQRRKREAAITIRRISIGTWNDERVTLGKDAIICGSDGLTQAV